MNVTSYTDGTKKATFHEDLDRALAQARADLARPDVVSTEQRAVDVYGPCPCGSGKKFKFCCKAKIGK